MSRGESCFLTDGSKISRRRISKFLKPEFQTDWQGLQAALSLNWHIWSSSYISGISAVCTQNRKFNIKRIRRDCFLSFRRLMRNPDTRLWLYDRSAGRGRRVLIWENRMMYCWTILMTITGLRIFSTESCSRDVRRSVRRSWRKLRNATRREKDAAGAGLVREKGK